MPLLAITCLVSAPGFTHHAAYSTPVAPLAKEPRPGDEIYLVIKPNLSKEVLNNAVSTLKTKGITLTYANDVYQNGKLVAIDVTINVEVPGKEKTTYSLSENSHDNAFEPMIFYYESAGERVGFVKEAPADLSRLGKQVVTNNLVGMAILNGNNTILHGSITTTWN
jgi:hypothetical protein